MATGDTEAVGYFLRHYAGFLAGVLRKHASAQEVDDMLQAVLLHMLEDDWRVLRTWNGACRFKTWLATVAINKCHDIQRSQGRHQRHVNLDDEGDFVDEAESLDSDIQCCHTRKMVQRMLRILAQHNERCYQILHMKYFCFFSYAQIAETLEITRNNVAVRLNRCLERCRNLFGRENPFHRGEL